MNKLEKYFVPRKTVCNSKFGVVVRWD